VLLGIGEVTPVGVITPVTAAAGSPEKLAPDLGPAREPPAGAQGESADAALKYPKVNIVLYHMG